MAFCEMCGAPLEAGAKFCEHCGARVAEIEPAAAPAQVAKPVQAAVAEPVSMPVQAAALVPTESAPAPAEATPAEPAPKAKRKRKPKAPSYTAGQGTKVTEHIWLCPDGVYRWSYEMNMLRNPTIMISVWKVIGLSIGIVMAFMFIVDLIQGNFDGPDRFAFLGQLLAIVGGIFFVLSIVAYLIVAALYGWKYQCLFEMTEEQVTHIQMPKQFKKAEAIGWLTTVVGLMSGKPYMVGLGINSAVRDISTSEFAHVANVKPRRWRNTIHVNYLLDKNQVYAEDEDFDFVEQFIVSRCTKAKVK